MYNTSTQSVFENLGSTDRCSVAKCAEILCTKWKPVILHLIRQNCHRFTDFKKAMPEISKQTLTNQLRELEKDQLVKRIVYNEMPPRIEYKLTALGHTAMFVVDEMERWGKMRLSRKSK